MRKNNQKGFADILGIVLIAIVIGLVGFIGWQNWDKVIKKEIVVTPTVEPAANSSPSPKVDSYGGWKSFTTKDKKYSLKYPPDWTLIDESEEVDLYNDGQTQLKQRVSISKSGYFFKSYNPIAFGPSVCIYADSPSFEGPSTQFKEFLEIKTSNNIYRRSKTPGDNLGGEVQTKRFSICRKESTSENFTTVAGFGIIWYEVPVDFDPVIVAIMDEILKTLEFTE